MREVICERCKTPFEHVCTDQIQLGRAGLFLGHLSNLVAGALPVDIYACPTCGEIKFFQEEGLPQKKCPQCGTEHDFDYVRCPACHFDHRTIEK